MPEHIEEVSLSETTQERYLNYALSVITSRALPDVRDGLKPVQRRILFGMHQLHLSADTRYRKSAQVVGEVMGKYHPHGDSAIYEAMVRMAQSFSLRYPLVDGHGNFGSLDGDRAAAMRYTEVRLTRLSGELLNQLNDTSIPFRPTYDNTLTEPTLLPATLPVLLLNGAMGIAVGMATNIPPHNLGEVVDACIALIGNPNLSTADLVKFIRAPDFPTGGLITTSPDKILEIYEEGHGTIEIRGEYRIEESGKDRKIIITSIPYTVNKAQLIERVAERIQAGKLPQLLDARDESTDVIRIVFELRPNANPEAAMAYLFKHTPLRSRFHVNMTCLVPSTNAGTDSANIGTQCRPRRLGLVEILRYFIEFRFAVVTRLLQQSLDKIQRRLHTLEAFDRVLNDRQALIETLQVCRDRKHAREQVQKRFKLDEKQATSVLDLPLYRLVQIEVKEVRSELATKGKEATKIAKQLASPTQRWNLVKSGLKNMRKHYNDPRRTKLGSATAELRYSEDDYIVAEDTYVIATRKGWIKRQRSYSDLSTIRVREEDQVGWVLKGSTRHFLILFSDRGWAYTARIADLSQTTGYGDPVQARFEFEDGESIIGTALSDPRLLPLPFDDAPEGALGGWGVAVTNTGLATRFSLDRFASPSTVHGRRFMRIAEGAKIMGVQICAGDEPIAVATENARAMVTWVGEIPVLKKAGKGVCLISLERTDALLGFKILEGKQDGLLVETQRGSEKLISASRYAPVRRGALGRRILQRERLVRVIQVALEQHGPPQALPSSLQQEHTPEDSDQQSKLF